MEQYLEDELIKQNYFTIKLTQIRSGHLTMKGKVNDVKALFILDTGASATVLDYNQVKDFNLLDVERHEEDVQGIGGPMARFNVGKVSMKFENQEVQSPMLSIIDLKIVNDSINMMYKNPKIIHGVIGADLLFKHKAIIDYSTKKIFLMKKK